ncbi:siderophore-iron reductase FhuF [Methylobacterium sp. Leaf118]|uniref:siderophore-iron reductase FhuF n=1 Tax=Methylobacterium sp. Leaf118 TaxID=2876562 RepID=UPI001E28F2C1|nr:siderophore-iron reductase FhuF [Methylobacterium sp. Leaf118]
MRPLTQTVLDDALTGGFAPHAGRLRLDSDPAAGTLAELAGSGALAAGIARFAEAHPGGERRAAASLWSAYLFAGLVAPSLAAGARLGRALTPERLRLDPVTGLPAAIHLAPEPPQAAPLPDQVERLLDACVAPAVRLLRAGTGLSARLLWENAGGHLFWTLDTLARECPERAGEARAALEALRWPQEACAALTLMRSDALAGHEAPRRRVCCLRHALPGFPHCPGICPLLRAPAPASDR